MIIDCVYNLSEGDIPKFEGCASNHVIDEHVDAISSAFKTIHVAIEVDDEWGFCKIIAVDGHPIQ